MDRGTPKKVVRFLFFQLIYVGIGLTKKISMRHFSKFWPYPPRLANNASFSVQAFSGASISRLNIWTFWTQYYRILSPGILRL